MGSGADNRLASFALSIGLAVTAICLLLYLLEGSKKPVVAILGTLCWA